MARAGASLASTPASRARCAGRIAAIVEGRQRDASDGAGAPIASGAP